MIASPGAPPRCVVIDEHPVVRHGVEALVNDRWPGAVVAAGRDLGSALQAADDSTPDVVVVDPWKAGTDIGDLVERLQGGFGASLVVFTAGGGSRMLSVALRAGVRGYVRKSSPPADLIRAIEAAQAGEFYVDPGLSSALVLEEGDRTLSARQRQILQMLADGMRTDAVASELGLSTETVRTHTKRILAKLEASTRTQAVAIGLRHCLIA